MACGLVHQHHYHHLFSIHSPNYYFSLNNYSYSPNQTASPFKCFTKCDNDNASRFRKIPKLSANKNTNNIPQKPKSLVTDDRVNGRDLDPDPDLDAISGSSVSNSFSALLHRLGDGFKLDGLGMEIMSIALPAALALAADPIASLVDTGYVGHLGSTELAAVGVSGAVFNLVSKLFNVPLLNITTSFVAEEQASVTKVADDYHQTGQDQQTKTFLPSVSTSIMLAAALGIIEAVALFTGSTYLMNTMGIPVVCLT